MNKERTRICSFHLTGYGTTENAIKLNIKKWENM